MKIIDGFIFYNELELLKARLHELYDVIDYFILVEGTLTFTGKTKPLYYDENKELFSKYNNKIIHIIVDDYPITTNPWDREHHQRKCIHRGISRLSLDPNDIIIISDVDEIPNSYIINSIKNNSINININTIYSLVMTLYYYTLEWTVSRKWYHVKLLSFFKYNETNNPEIIRHSFFEQIQNGGWHITYYGDTQFIINKLESFSEQQDNNNKNKDINYLNKCIEDGVLHFNNDKLIHIPITTNINLPKYFIKNINVENKSIIPKIAFTFWEGTQLSILHYLTVYSFSKYNPDYTIKIYYSNKQENFKHIDTNNETNNIIHASGFNFSKERCISLNDIKNITNVEIINIDVENEYNLNFITSPIHKADIIRICKLYEHGGIWFDLDILFVKKIPQYITESTKDILMFSYYNTIATGLIVSTPKNKAISAIYTLCLNKIRKSDINSDWQQFGPTLWMTCYKVLNKFFDNTELLDNNEIYPYMWNEPELFFYTNNNKIKDNTWGIHWYNGNINSRKFIDEFIYEPSHIDKDKSIFYKYLYDIINN